LGCQPGRTIGQAVLIKLSCSGATTFGKDTHNLILLKQSSQLLEGLLSSLYTATSFDEDALPEVTHQAQDWVSPKVS
jgi:hypothetical protein